MPEEFKVNDSAAHAPEEIRKLARVFLEAHDCPMVLSREESGYHLYLPCPDCLHTHGRKELQDPKYAINLSMLAGLGDEFRDTTKNSFMPAAVEERNSLEQRKEFGSGICMRTRSAKKPHRFPIDMLRNMATVTERHPDIMTKASMHGGASSAEREEMWEPDTVTGVSCPPAAGELLSISSLPSAHPAIQYLTARGYDPAAIEDQFRLSFCEKEYPYGQKGIYYRKMPGGWKDSPQHRIIFHSLIDGTALTWQARLIEKVSDDGLDRYMLHPYAGGFYPGDNLPRAMRAFKSDGHTGKSQVVWDESRAGWWIFMWSHTHTRSNPKASWMPVAPYDETRDGQLRFQPSKYRTAKYSSRQLMGWDAAIHRANTDPDMVKWCVLCEGPLDAARVGPGGIAIIGSSLSAVNSAKIAGKFILVFTAFDSDLAGRNATEKISRNLRNTDHRAPVLASVGQLPIPAGKDVGDMTQTEWDRLITHALKRAKRAL